MSKMFEFADDDCRGVRDSARVMLENAELYADLLWGGFHTKQDVFKVCDLIRNHIEDVLAYAPRPMLTKADLENMMSAVELVFTEGRGEDQRVIVDASE